MKIKCPATLGSADIHCIKGRIFRLSPLSKALIFERLCPCDACRNAGRREKQMARIASLMLERSKQ